MDERVFSVSCAKDSAVLGLKEAIEVEAGILPSMQRLIFRGKVLEDSRTLAFYSIDDGHTIHMVARYVCSIRNCLQLL
jgi:ubiquilin